jgi:hypothetical protein
MKKIIKNHNVQTDSIEKKEKFIELRAIGTSMDKIASELHLSKSTVAKWICDFESDIANRKYEEYERIVEKYNISKKERLETYTQLLEKALNELKNRDISSMSTNELIKFANTIENKIIYELHSMTYNTGEFKKSEFDSFLGKNEKIPITIKLDY